MMVRIFMFVVAAMMPLAVGAVGSSESEPPMPPPRGEPRRRPPLPDSVRKFRNGPGIWQVFSQLSPQERKEMQKLQREEPAKFREVMQAKAEELFRKRQARMAELRELAKQCRESVSPEKREQLRARLSAEVEKDFREHLAANRRQLEEMKRQTARMEKKLRRREANCAKAVAARVEAMIKGEPPRPHPEIRKKELEK